MRESSLRKVDEYWAREYFGVFPVEFHKPGVHIYPHFAMRGYKGVFLFRQKESCFISAPEELVELVNSTVAGKTPDEIFQTETIRISFPNCTKIIGPAWIGYAPENHNFTFSSDTSLSLTNGPNAMLKLEELKHDCDAESWEWSGIDDHNHSVVMYTENGKVVAAAGYELWGKHLAHIGVVTHPDYRGKGLGQRVVNEIAASAIQSGFIPQYRTLSFNTAAIKIGEKLGFQKYAETIAVRF